MSRSYITAKSGWYLLVIIDSSGLCVSTTVQGSAGLTSQHGGAHGQHSYASITSQGSPSSGEVPNTKSHAIHVTSPSESHDQRQLFSVDDEDDDRPPSAHTVHS